MGIYSGLGLPSRIRNEFFKRLSIAEAGTWAMRLGMPFSSDSESETYKWLGSVPIMRLWKGGRLEEQLLQQAYQIINSKYEATLGVDVDDVRRDKYKQIMVRVGELATRAATHWESLLTDLIIAGETGLCYDGQAYFDTDHSEGSSGTQTNDLTATEVPSADVATAAAPTAAELANVFVEMIQHMYGFKDDQGEPINQNAKQFIAMVPTTFMGAALRAVGQEYLAASTSNPLRALGEGITVTPVVNPRLTWTTKLALFRTDGMMKPLIMQEETPITAGMIGAGSEEEFKNDRWLFGIKSWRAVGYGLWQHAALVTLS